MSQCSKYGARKGMMEEAIMTYRNREICLNAECSLHHVPKVAVNRILNDNKSVTGRKVSGLTSNEYGAWPFKWQNLTIFLHVLIEEKV
jgi:hypothetical protein